MDQLFITEWTGFICDLQEATVAEVVPPAVAILHMAPAERSRSLVAHPAGLPRHIDLPHVPTSSPHEPLHRPHNVIYLLVG